ncbi:hypothetical protein LINPERPRIM_LOCUS30487 [Linum perenne]
MAAARRREGFGQRWNQHDGGGWTPTWWWRRRPVALRNRGYLKKKEVNKRDDTKNKINVQTSQRA